MEELKRCPFCGGKAETVGGKTEEEVAWVYCKQCYAESGTYKTKALAIQAWNRRTNEWLIL